MKLTTNICLAGTALLALAACDDADDAAVEPLDTEPEAVAVVTDFDPMTRDYALDPQAQSRREGFDEQAFRTEYGGYHDELVREQGQGNAAADQGNADSGMSDSGNTGNTGNTGADTSTQSGDDANSMRARENMTFEYLDRNDDNRLSVAEYAIWAIPVSPQHQAMNDQGQPELRADAINKTADSFFYYDRNGDSYLDSEELAAARRGQTFNM